MLAREASLRYGEILTAGARAGSRHAGLRPGRGRDHPDPTSFGPCDNGGMDAEPSNAVMDANGALCCIGPRIVHRQESLRTGRDGPVAT